jgi:predicted TIM-barrel fold metal-dependent hydrolase
MTTALLEGTTRDALWTGTIIDADIHANVPSLDALKPYLPEVWVDWADERGYRGPRGAALAYPPGSERACRTEWRPEGGTPPASTVELLQQHVIEPWGLEKAIVNCYYGVDSLRHPDWAAALASAVNDWLIAEWFDKDPRLVGSLVIPARDPDAAIKEINRVGGHPQFKQVLATVRTDRLWGQRIWHPVLAAMVEHDLVMGIHYGGTAEAAPSSSGYATWYTEEYAAEWSIYMAQVTSLVAEGCFQKFPDLRVSVLEGGFAWIPSWSWRMNKEWMGLRRETPWVDRPPWDIVRDHMRFSIAPADLGPVEGIPLVIDWLETEDFLMFATDYPHRHDDDIAALLAALPETMRPKVMSETARDWYRL